MSEEEEERGKLPHWQHDGPIVRMDEAALTGILIDYHEAEKKVYIEQNLDAAIFLLDCVWNRLKPYARKEFLRPSDRVQKRIDEEAHTECELLGNPFFEYTNRRQRMFWLYSEQERIKMQEVREILKDMIDRIDKFKMYLPSYGAQKDGSSNKVVTVVD